MKMKSKKVYECPELTFIFLQNEGMLCGSIQAETEYNTYGGEDLPTWDTGYEDGGDLNEDFD